MKLSVVFFTACAAFPLAGQGRSAVPGHSAEAVRLKAENDSLRQVIAALRHETSSPVAPPSPASADLDIDALAGVRAEGTISDDYDRFRDKNTLMAINLPTDHDLRFSLMEVFSGPGHTSPTAAAIIVESSSPTWKYLQCHTLDLLVDGEHVTLTANEHKGNVQTGYVTEQIIGVLKTPDALRIASGRVVEGELCNDQFRLTPGDMMTLKQFAKQAHS